VAERPGSVKTNVALSLFYGDAEILRNQAAHQVINAWLDESDREYGLATLSGSDSDPGRVAAEINGVSLLSPRKVVLVQKTEAFSNSQQKALAGLLAKVPAGVAVVLLAAVDPDARGRSGPPVAADLRKVVEANGQTVAFMTPYERELPAWVSDEAGRQGKHMKPHVAQALVEMVGADMDRLHQEVRKLATYVGDAREITPQDVAAVACRSGEADVFKLVDALGRRDAKAALDMLPLFLPVTVSAGAALPILAMIARQFRLIWQARMVLATGARLDDLKEAPAGLEGSLPDQHNLIAAIRGKRFLATKYAQQARNFSDEALARALEEVHRTDLALKGQGSEQMDDRMAMELLIVSLCTN
jgi:DNA polymerase III subunit delta